MGSYTPQPSPIGFAGLGAMGVGMALNLMKAGFDVRGFDVSQVAKERFQTAGGHAVESIAESCQGCKHYFAMVATGEQMDALCFEPEGLCKYLEKDAILCISSTLPPSYPASLLQRLVLAGRSDINIVECPVSGGFVGAANGTLSIMITAEERYYQQVKPELEAMAAPGRLFYCGTVPGSANRLKMLNQHLAGTHIVVAAEVLSFAKALKLSTRKIYDLVMAGSASSWIFGDRGQHMLDADWTPKSAVDIFVKDLGIVCEGAKEVSFDSLIANEAYRTFTAASTRGYGRRDDAAVVCMFEEDLGISVAENPTAITDHPVRSGTDEQTGVSGLSSDEATRLVLRLGILLHVAAAAECCRLAEACGLSTATVYQLIAGAAGSSSQFVTHFLNMSARNFETSTTHGEDVSVATFESALSDLHRLSQVASAINFPSRLLRVTNIIFRGTAKKGDMRGCSVAAVVKYWD